MEAVRMIERLEGLFENWGYLIVFITSLIESTPLGWATPGGMVLATAGFYANGGRLTLAGVMLAGFMGTWLMLVLAYLAGKKTGMKIAKIFNQENRVIKTRKLVEKRGWAIMTATLTSNVTRFWMSYVAGLQKYTFKKFAVYSGLASTSWVLLWAVAGFLTGGERANLERLLPRLSAFSGMIFVVAIGSLYWVAKKEYEDIGN